MDDGTPKLNDGQDGWTGQNTDSVGNNFTYTYNPAESAQERKMLKLYSKVKKLLKKTNICKDCPDRYKAITNGHECCIDYDEGELVNEK